MIEVSGISKTYGQNRALSDVSFTVEKGEILGTVITIVRRSGF